MLIDAKGIAVKNSVSLITNWLSKKERNPKGQDKNKPACVGIIPIRPVRNPKSITAGIIGKTIRLAIKEMKEKVPDILINSGNIKI